MFNELSPPTREFRTKALVWQFYRRWRYVVCLCESGYAVIPGVGRYIKIPLPESTEAR